jgi:hypothetical protein
MEPITDEYMTQMRAKTRMYTMVLLAVTPKFHEPDSMKIVWEHGRRNFQLRASGDIAIVCPCRDDSDWAGFAVFTGTPERVTEIMDSDPGVQAGIFTYEVHPVASFPGDALPA